MYVIGPYVSIRQLIDFGDFSDAPDRQRAKFEIMSQFYVVIFSNKGIKNMSAELELRLTWAPAGVFAGSLGLDLNPIFLFIVLTIVQCLKAPKLTAALPH